MLKGTAKAYTLSADKTAMSVRFRRIVLNLGCKGAMTLWAYSPAPQGVLRHIIGSSPWPILRTVRGASSHSSYIFPLELLECLPVEKVPELVSPSFTAEG